MNDCDRGRIKADKIVFTKPRHTVVANKGDGRIFIRNNISIYHEAFWPREIVSLQAALQKALEFMAEKDMRQEWDIPDDC